ncbi:MAG: energy-coupling factor transporter transmembrane protein EcfT [Muribaculaceae bacterium]|nr:energy-coupling factor transporter transmembrane protein EcfT [Muribaculaceae bacterium]
MSDRLQRAILTLNRLEQPGGGTDGTDIIAAPDSRCLLVLTLIYLVLMLSVPLADIERVLLFSVYPIVESALVGIKYTRLLKRSLWVLPLVALVGVFNPILDTRTVFTVYGFTVTAGWVSLISLIVRGLLAMQAVLILIYVIGFYEVAVAIRRLGCPAVMSTQILLVYRYLSVLLQQVLTMRRAVDARGYGRRHMSLKLWGIFIGQLLIRSLERAENVSRAMHARGFTDRLPLSRYRCWTTTDSVLLGSWTVVFIVIYLVPLGTYLSKVL